jgi:hypothetical protein
MIHVIRKILIDTSEVTGLVPANKISLVIARQGMQRPYIAIDLEGTGFDRSNQGVAQEVYNVVVYITDTHLSDAWSIQSAVKNALSEFSGSKTVDGVTYEIGQISFTDVMTDAHELHDFYIVACQMNVFVYP